MNKRILFAVLAVAFFIGGTLRLVAGGTGTAYGIMLLIMAGAATWFSIKSRRE